jgi:ribosome-interacting GTPase 1
MIREPGLTDDQLIDVLNGNRVYVPALTVLNKIDLVKEDFVNKVKPEGHKFIPISADTNVNIEKLKESIYENLDFIRIYMRPKGGETDYREPMIMRRGCTIGDVCNKIHRNMIRDFRFAQIWGKSAKFDGQKVGLDHTLSDQDVLTIVKKINTL